MRLYKVYFRHNNHLTHGFFEAPDAHSVRWRVLGRFYGAVICNVVDVTRFQAQKAA